MRQVDLELRRPAGANHRAMLGCQPTEMSEQCGLADARLAGQDDHLIWLLNDRLECPSQRLELCDAADQRRR
jgi:hypothetical protein